MSAIITCHDVSIRYITGDFKDIGIKEYVVRHLTGNYKVTEFWADRHVSFELEPGDMLGIIGSNGAGKSTLLKAISGIMAPTEGYCERNGKISALLELGSGFDGDLTVRENTYLRAAMLGYSRDFIDAAYDSIIEFAELQEFQERPFKQLSSGMKSRLAFSIASLVEPEILILDEVLSVGDGAFRKKSEAKMREIIGGGATTILVSHSLDQVRSMSNKILWLDHGNQVAFGNNVKGLCDAYQRYLDTKVLPGPDELPPLDVEVAQDKAREGREAVELRSAGEEGAAPRGDAGPSAQAGTAGSGEQAPAASRRPTSGTLRHVPRAVWFVLAGLLALTALIALDEARLPGQVRSLPQTAQQVVYRDEDRGVGAYLWEGKLYVFVPADWLSAGETFYLSSVDGHGRVTQDQFPVERLRDACYSTPEQTVLVVEMGRYPGYRHLVFGLAAPGQSLEGLDEETAMGMLLWGGSYDKDAERGRMVGD